MYASFDAVCCLGEVMKKQLNFLAGIALVAVLNLCGCVSLTEQQGDRFDRGDLIDRNGVRYVGWCDSHPHNVHCIAQASEPSADRG